ncbi:MAG: acyl-CoA dehydrogenase family protein [Pseudomonadota bacterium]
MDFQHTEDRRMLADMAGRYVREQYAIEDRHKIAAGENGYSKEKWAEFAELGLIGALFGEEVGGFGGAGFDIAVVFEELGKGLVVEPFLANLIAGKAISVAGSDQQKAMLESVIGGETTLALAYGEPTTRYSLNQIAMGGSTIGNGYVLNGHKSVVLNGDSADHLVVAARTSGTAGDDSGLSLFLIDANSEGISRRGFGTNDGYKAAEIMFSKVEVSQDALIGTEGEGLSILETAIGWGILAVCAEALGAMQVASDQTLDYLKTRKQFGVPIGKFQALQHRLVDMLIEIEQVRSALINAAGHMDAPANERDWHLSSLKNLVGRAGKLIGEESIQMHGGIGMTFEYSVAHFAKRLIMIDHLFGDTDHHLKKIIDLSGKRAA